MINKVLGKATKRYKRTTAVRIIADPTVIALRIRTISAVLVYLYTLRYSPYRKNTALRTTSTIGSARMTATPSGSVKRRFMRRKYAPR